MSTFDAIAEARRDREALVVPHQDVRWTYAELRRRVDELALGLVRLGLEPGDRLGIWSPNCAEWVLTQFASAKAGLVLVNINPAYLRDELEYALNKVECKALILAPRIQDHRLHRNTAGAVAGDGALGQEWRRRLAIAPHA